MAQEGQLAATETSVFGEGEGEGVAAGGVINSKAHPADNTSVPPHQSIF